MVQIPLVINGQRLKTLEELRENFNLVQLIERFHGGQLRAWLHNWEFEMELEQVEALASDLPEAELAEALCRIFGVEGDCKEKAIHDLMQNQLENQLLLSWQVMMKRIATLFKPSGDDTWNS